MRHDPRALVALVLLTPPVVGWWVWHARGYYNGRYARWSQQQHGTLVRLNEQETGT